MVEDHARLRIGTKPQTCRVSSAKICRVGRILNRGSPIKVALWMLKTAIDQTSRLMPGRGICSTTCADAMSGARASCDRSMPDAEGESSASCRPRAGAVSGRVADRTFVPAGTTSTAWGTAGSIRVKRFPAILARAGRRAARSACSAERGPRGRLTARRLRHSDASRQHSSPMPRRDRNLAILGKPDPKTGQSTDGGNYCGSYRCMRSETRSRPC